MQPFIVRTQWATAAQALLHWLLLEAFPASGYHGQ